ncbi:c-type cytochrome [Paraburkholderia phosphatilytica]|uniref:c-type cytochrome n=1 Tax=Paraburkholderia phosphatilytica TaxID=2282883 RepID=UPI000E531CFF|nr:c-type cytochrome [Paraburkholderia phosphatilytica]
MSTLIKYRIDSLVAAALLGTLAPLPATSVAGVRVCTFPGSPSAALDRHVSSETFAAAGVPITLVADGIGDADDDGVSLKELHRVLGRDCDVIAGFPRSSVADASGHDLIFSQGYLKSGYVDVRLSSSGNGNGVGETANGNVVAAMYASPAQLIALQQSGVKLDLRNTSASTVEAVVNGEAARAVVWYPAVVAYGLAHPSQHFRVAPAASPYADWHLVFAFPAKSAALRRQVDDALVKLTANGQLDTLTKAWTLPDRTVSSIAPSIANGMHTAAWRATSNDAPRLITAVATTSSTSRMIRVADSADAGTGVPSFEQTQADHGKGLYASSCAKCHGAALQGVTAPALKGPAFAPASNSHLTIGGVYGYMATNMPADKPGKLKDQDYADIMAFLLYSNGYAAGSAKLTADRAKASSTPLNAGSAH